MELDKDLRSVQEVRELMRRAKKAEGALAAMSQKQLDEICRSVSRGGEEQAETLGRMAAEETGFGIPEDKKLKNLFAAKHVYEAIREERTVGILARDREKGTVDIGVPVGIVAAIVPSTNPTSTVIYKTMICLKAGNPVIFSPHPGAVKSILAAVEIVRRAAEQAGAPEGSVGCITTPTLEATQDLMRHPDTKLILATGGGAMVKAAYSSGTPAIGVGAGNGPAFLHKSADVPAAVRRILESKTFDNGTICASEQSIVVTEETEPAVRAELLRQGGYFLNEAEAKALSGLLLRANGTMNPALVGKSARQVAHLAGLSNLPEGTKVLLAREDGVGKGHPFSGEKLCPVLAYYVEKDEDAALLRCREILLHEGAGHTFSIHAEDENVVEKFALAMPASRVLVNTPSALGGIGATTGLFPALTLGCGAVGGSSSSNNIGPLDLVNIKRIAYGKREMADLRKESGASCRKEPEPSEEQLEQLVREICRRLK